MKGTTCLAFAMALAAWPLGPAQAGSRCVPNKRFVVLSGALVSDTLTGLVWQQQASTSTMTWAAAKTYCPSGFRLPTLKELNSIVDLTVAFPGPTIDRVAFPGTPAGAAFWTSSPYVGSSGGAWIIDFTSGFSGTGNDATVGNTYNVRCVR